MWNDGDEFYYVAKQMYKWQSTKDSKKTMTFYKKSLDFIT
jgi:hypothetical protein